MLRGSRSAKERGASRFVREGGRMKTLGYAGAFLLLLAEIAGAQQAPEIKPENRGQAQQAAAEPMVVPLAVGTAFNVKLITPIDARHNKAGEVFAVETVETVRYQGSVIFPRGTTIYGHLVRCTTSGHGHHGSGLFLQFDKAELKTGGEAVLNAGVQALAAGPNQPALRTTRTRTRNSGWMAGIAVSRRTRWRCPWMEWTRRAM